MSSRRAALKITFAACAALLGSFHSETQTLAQSRPKLLVFVPTDIPTHALQKLLRAAIPHAEITVFSRFRDFDTGLISKPDAVLTLQPLLQAKGLTSNVVGKTRGSAVEAYSLIAIGRQAAPEKLASVGAVDVLGRQGMKDLVARVLGSAPRVERVSKLEDLLPLLQFETAEAVLLPGRLVEPFRARSKLDLRASSVRGGVGLPALSALSSAGSALAADIKALSPAISQQMGVEQWE